MTGLARDFVYERPEEDPVEELVETPEVEVKSEEGTGSASIIRSSSSAAEFILDRSPSPIAETILDDGATDPVVASFDAALAEADTQAPSSTSASQFVLNSDVGMEYKKEEPQLYTAAYFELPTVQNSISIYLTGRDGKKNGAKQDGESAKEYAERYFTHMRWLESNLYHTGKGIAWLGNLEPHDPKSDKPDQKANFALLYTAYKEMPGAFSEGGGDAFSAVQDYIYASVLDPVNVVTLGSAMALKVVGGRMAGQVLLRAALKNAAPRIAVSGGIDTLMGAVQESAIQTVQQRADMIEEKNWTAVAAVGLLNGTLGTALNVGALWHGARNVDYAANVQAELDTIRLSLDPNSATHKLSARAGAKSTEHGVGRGGTVYDPERAKKLMDANSPKSNVSEGLIDSDVSIDIIKAAGKVMELIPDLRHTGEEKASDAIMDILSTVFVKGKLKKLAPWLADTTTKVRGKQVPYENFIRNSVNALQRRLKKDGITQEEFAQMFRLSMENHARAFQQVSSITQKINGLTNLSKAELALLDPKMGEDLLSPGWARRLYDGAKSWDRARRAILTMMPITTVRNIGGASAYVSFETASRMLVETYVATGKTIRAAVEGRSSVKGIKDGLNDIVKNGFGLMGKMVSAGDNRAWADLLIQGHPKLEHALLRTTTEAGEHELARGVRALNVLNIAQDQYIRSGVFVDSIERQLKVFGMDAKVLLAEGKHIPTPIVKKAVDDALVATFSAPAKGIVAKSLLKAVEGAPFIATAEFPFMRFMLNALHFQYKYSPLNVWSAGARRLNYNRMLSSSATKNQNKAAIRLQQQSTEEFGRAAVGTAAIMAAMKYRYDNQDSSILSVYSDDGEVTNVAALYPLPSYLAVGDLFVKMLLTAEHKLDRSKPKPKDMDWSEFSQGIVGLQKAPFDSFGNFISAFSDTASDGVADERMYEVAGKFIGGIFGQYMTPIKFARQVIAAFDDEESITRDPNAIEGEGMQRGFNRAVSEVQRNVPYYSKNMPARYVPTRGVPKRNDLAVVSQLTGSVGGGFPTAVEKELEDFGHKLWTITAQTGNKRMDALVKKYMHIPLNLFMESLMSLHDYDSLSRRNKGKMITEIITDAKDFAIQLAHEELYGIDAVSAQALIDKTAWQKLTGSQRAAVDEDYIKLKGENPHMIPKGGNIYSTIYEDKRFALGVFTLHKGGEG